ncbi:hypothetical protein I6F18_19945 [Bradyrhizobium sp. NBAIM32]|uniref:hypothetical protein n=1 Tax=Bradyrhizobium sp. NBAIM32 TaxID=2793809 RepID=UPI001CD7B876|nr:hypothetical protein [Bradyrhizobium sp. NBAIM32]MCA1542233.1 hypothetical protein [Bradyrhizobium sp. NBAIM32]
MPQLVEFEGQRHEFPDDFTQADIQRALSSRPRAPQPTQVRGPDGAIVEFPAGTSKEEMTTALQRHYGSPTQPTMPALPPGYKLDPPATIPPLPPGYKLDRPVTDPALIAPLAGAAPAAKPGMFDDLIPKGRTFDFTSPDGKTYRVSGPEGATVEQAWQILQQQLNAQSTARSAAPKISFGDLIPGQGASRQPTLVPVDHDPWAAFPDAPTATRPVTDPALPAQLERSAPAVPITRSGRIYVTPEPPKPIERPASVLPSSVGGAVRDFQVGAQGVGKGLTDIVTGPFDLVAGAQNAVVSGINRIAGTNIPMATPASKLVEKAVDATGLPVIDPATMSRSEKLAYDANRFGTQAVGTGAMLAQRAPQVAASVTRSETLPGRVLDHMARPYTEAPARTLIGDSIGGVGAGVAVNAADNYVPDDAIVLGHYVGHGLKDVTNVLAPLAGASGANTLQAGVETLGSVIRNLATKTFTSAPAPIPLNPATKTPYSNSDVDRAAEKLQSATTGSPRALAQDIRDNAAALAKPDDGAAPLQASAMPTSGLLSRDPGLIAAEQAARLKSSPEFVKRDQAVKAAAAERVEAMRDPEADLGSVMRRAAEARAERMNAAESDLLQREDAVNSLDQIRRDQGQPLSAVASSEAKANASRRLDRALVEDTYLPARQRKNELFDTAPGRNEELPADEVFGAIDRIRAGANNLAPGTLPEDFMRRLNALRPQMVEHPPGIGQMVNVGGPGTASGADLANLRKFIGPAQQQAQARGNFDLADNLGRLRAAINRTIEEAPGYAEANANYHQFAERFRPEPNDAMAKFTRAIDRGGQNADGEFNRGATPPSETASRLLATPESAATVSRALRGSPVMTAGETALRDHYRSSLAMSALNPDGTINPIRASAWANSHAEILAQFPAIRREFDDIIAQARRGEQLSMQARADLEAARTARKTTEAEVDRSVVGTLIREDPREAASSVLNDKYGGPKKLDEITALVRNDAQAQRGWKAAMSEVLADKVQGTRQVGETLEVQFARLAKEFKDNETLLAKTFSPEEMNNLRQAHKILSYFKEAEKRATVGSDTAEKINIPGWAQLAVRHFKGDLAGGGLIKRLKLLLEMLPSNKQNADEIIHMAWFAPNVAAYLLERPVKNPNVPQYNIDLRRLIAAANASREN